MKKIRMIDVAEAAGVSKSTVSQYLNGRFNYMSDDTKSRIEKAVKQLNYIPNPIARSLKTDYTKTIGVIVTAVTGYFTGQVIRGIDDYCKQKGYNVFIENTDFKPDEERKSLAQLKQMHVDGLIIAASGENNALISQEEQNGFPIVQVHIEYDDLETSIVLSDYRKGAFEATEYLIKMGHRRIAFLTQPYDGARSRYDRYLGYCEAHEKYGIPVDKNLIQIWDRARPNSPETLINCENPPTAFFTMQQDITVELLLALDKAGKEVPRDHSVISFHELPLVELMKVPVTVIRQSPYDIGRESARILLRQIQSDERILERVVLPCTFIERKSCAPPTGKEGTA